MTSASATRPHSLHVAGTFAAVSMSPVKRLICHLLIVWLALLSGGAHAHAAADAAQELGHIAAHAVEGQGVEHAAVTHDHGHSETCGLNHCGHGHATGMLPNANLHLSDVPAIAALPTPQAWASHEQANSIERPKWQFTTPAVVNL